MVIQARPRADVDTQLTIKYRPAIAASSSTTPVFYELRLTARPAIEFDRTSPVIGGSTANRSVLDAVWSDWRPGLKFY